MRKFATAATIVLAMTGAMAGVTAASAQGRPGPWHRGDAPPPPPAHFHQHDRWERHVSACLDRYRSYDPRTDSYNAGRGHMRRCRL